MLLFMLQFYLFASTFAHLLIAALPDAETVRCKTLQASWLDTADLCTGWQYRNTLLFTYADLQWGHAVADSPARVLDIHVPPLAIHLSGGWRCRNGTA